MLYATLGEIVFQAIESPERFESTRPFTYAEHKVVEARPKLQWISDDLETITLEMLFHVSFTNPKTQLDLLQAAAESHTAQALVFGNGVHEGYFVITSITEILTQQADDGSLMIATARVELKEDAISADPSAPPTPNAPPPAIIQAAPGTVTTPIPFDPTNPVSVIANALPESGLATLVQVPSGPYTPPSYNVPGVSPIVNSAASTGSSGPSLMPDDVDPDAIVGMA